MIRMDTFNFSENADVLSDLVFEWVAFASQKENHRDAKAMLVVYQNKWAEFQDSKEKTYVRRLFIDALLTELVAMDHFDFNAWFGCGQLDTLKPIAQSALNYHLEFNPTETIELDFDEYTICKISNLATDDNETLSSIIRRLIENAIEHENLVKLNNKK